jgi:hypothetical protein
MISRPSYPSEAASSKAAAVGSGKTDELDRSTGTRDFTLSSLQTVVFAALRLNP